MRYTPLDIPGAFVLDPEPIDDSRGSFAMMWSATDFARQGLNPHLEQANLSLNCRKGTVRGMHWQDEPHAEAKLVRCQSGMIFDIVLDLRRDSPTYQLWRGYTLSAENRRMLYIPEGCAHGFQSLVDNAEVFYLVSKAFAPDAVRGVRWDDPTFAITWPLEVTCISDRDRAYPNWE